MMATTEHDIEVQDHEATFAKIAETLDIALKAATTAEEATARMGHDADSNGRLWGDRYH